MKSKAFVVLRVGVTLLALLGIAGGVAASPLPKPPEGTSDATAAAAGTQRLVIPAAAFTPVEEGCDYENHGRYLIHRGGTDGLYVAPIHLPQAAQVCRVTLHYYDDYISPVVDVYAVMYWTELTGVGHHIAELESYGAPGHSSDTHTFAVYPQIDNTGRSYFMLVELSASTGPGSDAWLCSIVIEYIRTAMEPASKGYLSLPAAAFAPYEDGYDFVNTGGHLWHKHGPGGSNTNGWYLAPVFLPHGATVTKMTFYYYDQVLVGQDAIARLQRTEFGQGNYLEMAYVQSEYATGSEYNSKSDTSILYATIDNAKYAYWVVWDLSVAYSVNGCGVVIEYDKPTTTPSVNYISIPAAAFKPFADEWEYQNHGRYLKHQDYTPNAHYEAATSLPQGAVVTKVTFHYADTSPGNTGYAHLCRANLSDADYLDMAYMFSGSVFDPAPGFDLCNDHTIVAPGVDNTQYSYWAYWELPFSHSTFYVWGCGMVIEYTYRVYLPLVVKSK